MRKIVSIFIFVVVIAIILFVLKSVWTLLWLGKVLIGVTILAIIIFYTIFGRKKNG